MLRWITGVVVFAALVFALSPPVREEFTRRIMPDRDINEIRARVSPVMAERFASAGLAWGAPVYLRVFKEERALELWVADGARYRLFETYAICNHSGDLGPKLREGDRQSPEGFYRVDLGALNPNSSYHLSFNLGFPNAFDRAQGRTGSFLMIHGACVSVGCYAMTDQGIEDIYLAVEAALNGGQGFVPVHAFPFRMTEERMAEAAGSQWVPFWRDLKAGYDAFEAMRVPPKIGVTDGRYVLAGG